MRIVSFALVVIAAVAVAATAAARSLSETEHSHGANRSLRINWTDLQPITGGRLVYRATSIILDRDRFAVTASVTNKSSHRVLISGLSPAMTEPGTVQPPTFGV